MVWLIVLSGYPKSGKTSIARAIVKKLKNCARIGSDDLREMFFGENYPCRNEQLLWTIIEELSRILQDNGYHVVMDSSAPNNVMRRRLLDAAADRRMLLVVRASEEVINERGGGRLLTLWKTFWEEPRVEADMVLDEKCEESADIERIAVKVTSIIRGENSASR